MPRRFIICQKDLYYFIGQFFLNFVTKLSTSRLLVAVFLFYGLLAMSPIWGHIGWRGVLTAALAVFLTFPAVLAADSKARLPSLLFIFLLLVSAFATAIYWGDIRFFFGPIFLITAVWLLQFGDKRTLERFVDAATLLLGIALVGAIIGFVLALRGIEPIWVIQNPDGRPNWLFLTTFSNHRSLGFIRPSGFFDEPGAFSFVICVIAGLRHLLKKNSKTTWLLLIGGLVTFSLAHLIYMFFHLVAQRIDARNFLSFVGLFAAVVIVAIATGFSDLFVDRLFWRLTLSESGTLAGDNRSWRLLNAYYFLAENPSALFFGADPSCRFDYETCKSMFPLMGENPLAPIVHFGLMQSWPYILVLAVLLLSPLYGRHNLVLFGIALLLLQRPYILAIGYSFLTWLCLVIFVAGVRQRRRSSSNERVRSLEGAVRTWSQQSAQRTLKT